MEGFKLICYIALQLTSALLYMNAVPQYNVWKLLDFLKELFYTVCIASNQATDIFLASGGFLGLYKGSQIYDANGGFLSLKDVGKMYARKYFRLAPTLYIVFFLGWVFGPRLMESPAWINYTNLYY